MKHYILWDTAGVSTKSLGKRVMSPSDKDVLNTALEKAGSTNRWILDPAHHPNTKTSDKN